MYIRYRMSRVPRCKKIINIGFVPTSCRCPYIMCRDMGIFLLVTWQGHEKNGGEW